VWEAESSCAATRLRMCMCMRVRGAWTYYVPACVRGVARRGVCESRANQSGGTRVGGQSGAAYERPISKRAREGRGRGASRPRLATITEAAERGNLSR
jgi:hypothetical protein